MGTVPVPPHLIGQSQPRFKEKEIVCVFWCEEQQAYVGEDSSQLSKRGYLKYPILYTTRIRDKNNTKLDVYYGSVSHVSEWLLRNALFG